MTASGHKRMLVLFKPEYWRSLLTGWNLVTFAIAAIAMIIIAPYTFAFSTLRRQCNSRTARLVARSDPARMFAVYQPAGNWLNRQNILHGLFHQSSLAQR